MAHAQTVLKLPLVPLQVGHLKLLRESESPFFSGEQATILDVLCAALICAMPQSECGNVFKWWFRPAIWFWSLCCRIKPDVWTIEAAKLRKHFNDALHLNRVKRAGQPDGKEVTSPLDRRLYQMLRAEINCSHDEALDYPVREAIDLWVTLAEQKGAVELWTDDELAHIEWHKQQEAAMLAGEARN